MAVLGIRVVDVEGRAIHWRAAALRALVLPLSIALAPIGLSGIVVRSDRRALHDLCAKTCVVYHWNVRTGSRNWATREV